jgi:Ca2+/Na+ antiporter
MMCTPPEVPLKRRWFLYTAISGATFLACVFFPSLLEHRVPGRDYFLIAFLFSWMFPVGLAAWFNHPSPLDDLGLMAVLWLAYLVYGFFTLKSRTTVRSYALLLILAIVLAFNVADLGQ